MSVRKKLYDLLNNRLVYIDREADEDFWDKKWEKSSKSTFLRPPRHGMTIRTTSNYLPAGSRVLEGGCGLGDIVYALDKAEYVAEGIDFAPKVVEAINVHWPHLNVTIGDVRHLSARDDYYDGYWSIGVIEHFAEGYDLIAHEMLRVLRPGGIIFLSFPSFNQFRQSQAAAGKYPQTTIKSTGLSGFYQYALDPLKVQADFETLGFELLECRGKGALQSFSEDTTLGALFQRLLGFFPSRVGVSISMAMDLLFGDYAGHSSLLIMRKK